MIIVKISGGLGNQMFQYAIGRYLSLKHNTYLKFEDDFFEYKNDSISTKRKVELEVFNVVISKATEEDLSPYIHKSKIRKRIESLFPYLEQNHQVIEKDHIYDNTIIDSKNNSYLNGYWQSEKYFSSIREVLLKDFTPKNPINQLNASYYLKCFQKNTVSIHIRRGDYVNIESNLTYHGVCSLDYYYEAISYLQNLINGELKLIVFTDDLNWVNDNFKPTCTFESITGNNNENSFYDMYLMSKCHHNIVANSSFSWWGAWLNNNPDKKVIAPKIWFATNEINSNQVVPESWIRL